MSEKREYPPFRDVNIIIHGKDMIVHQESFSILMGLDSEGRSYGLTMMHLLVSLYMKKVLSAECDSEWYPPSGGQSSELEFITCICEFMSHISDKINQNCGI